MFRRQERLEKKAREIIANRDKWERKHGKPPAPLPGREYVRGRHRLLVDEINRQLAARTDEAKKTQVSAELTTIADDQTPATRRGRVVERAQEFRGAMKELLAIDRERRAADNQTHNRSDSFILRNLKRLAKKIFTREIILKTVGIFFLPLKRERLIASIWLGLKTAAGIGSDRFLEAAKIYAARSGVTATIELTKPETRFANLTGALLLFASKSDVRKVVQGVKYVNAALAISRTPQPTSK